MFRSIPLEFAHHSVSVREATSKPLQRPTVCPSRQLPTARMPNPRHLLSVLFGAKAYKVRTFITAASRALNFCPDRCHVITQSFPRYSLPSFFRHAMCIFPRCGMVLNPTTLLTCLQTLVPPWHAIPQKLTLCLCVCVFHGNRFPPRLPLHRRRQLATSHGTLCSCISLPHRSFWLPVKVTDPQTLPLIC